MSSLPVEKLYLNGEFDIEAPKPEDTVFLRELHVTNLDKIMPKSRNCS